VQYKIQSYLGFLKIVISAVSAMLWCSFNCISAHQTHHAYEGGKSSWLQKPILWIIWWLQL